MSAKRKNIEAEIKEEKQEEVKNQEQEQVKTEEIKEEKQKEIKSEQKEIKKSKIKYPIGSIVYISKEAEADLNGFKLFPQYKKYTYTVEGYDEISEVYSLRRLNLLLKLKEELIMAPGERAHDALSRKQF